MNVYSLALFRHDASGYESERAGTSRGIFFDNFMPTVIRCFREVWKGWELRIHHDKRAETLSCWPLLTRLHSAELLRLVMCGEAKTLCGSMLWRMRPTLDPEVAITVCRDVDSLPMHRDRKMVEEAFSFPGVKAHAILDSESHSGPLMGGMIAFRGYSPSASPEACTDIDFNRHGSDQQWLNRLVWPQVSSHAVIHQRRKAVLYPGAYRTLPAAPQETVLDQVVNHVGAGYDREKALKAVRDHHPDTLLDMLETMAWPKRDYAENVTGRPDEPWYTREAIEILRKELPADASILEYGGGASSVWYAERYPKLHVVEHNPIWETMIRHHWNAAALKGQASMSRMPLQGAYDLVAVDGVDREAAILQARDWVKPGGLLLLDNSEEHPGIKLHGWEKRVTFNGRWGTTIWRRPHA